NGDIALTRSPDLLAQAEFRLGRFAFAFTRLDPLLRADVSACQHRAIGKDHALRRGRPTWPKRRTPSKPVIRPDRDFRAAMLDRHELPSHRDGPPIRHH